MASGSGSDWPQSGFLPRGVVMVSPAALDLARAFAAKMRVTQPGEDQVVSFDWADTRSRRAPGGPREEIGAGIDFATWARAEVPAECIELVDGLEFAIGLPEPARSLARECVIDRDDSLPTKLVLR